MSLSQKLSYKSIDYIFMLMMFVTCNRPLCCRVFYDNQKSFNQGHHLMETLHRLTIFVIGTFGLFTLVLS